ncbi:hypothetical protein [Streptomyces sp. F-3]|uniref:hypothetical protein n=1 Tax=Streptomyces sp. F-3 TaxID=1840095 RepID=UPI000B11CE2B|nr:hypothetical protein [Streptomyces sp. F-3]
MTSSFFATALLEAFETPDPRDAVSRIKDVVARELEEADSRATIKKTDFFNHTFAPDLVLQWPGENERFVFLKSDTRPEIFREDVEAVRSHNPIVFALDRIAEGYSPIPRSEQSTTEPEDNTLVADSQGMEVLITRRRSAPVVGLATSAVLQGGRGLLTEAEAESMTSSIVAGFSGAQVLDAEATSQAVSKIVGHFDARRTSRLLRFLSAVWVGSGGSLGNFPGQHNVTGDLDSTALSFLLDLPPIEDYEFWRRIGRSLTLDSITQLEFKGSSENLCYLIEANLDALHARACRVVDRQPELGEEVSRSFRWALYKQMLALVGPHKVAYFTSKVDDLKAEPSRGEGISLRQLRDRVDASGVPISELELATPTRTVSYATVNHEDITHDQELMELSRTFSSGALVKSAVATLLGSRQLICDFPTQTGKGRTTSKFPLGLLTRIAFTLLSDPSRTEQEEVLRVTRHYSPSASEQPALFDLEDSAHREGSSTLLEDQDLLW